MATLKKQFINHLGLDLKSSDLVRRDEFASAMRNAQYRKDGSLEKRPGFKASAGSNGGFGIATYNRIDSDGVLQEELVTVSDRLFKEQKATLDVTYSGAAAPVIFSLFFDVDADEYKAQILEGTTLVLDEGLGKGFDEASIKTIDSLRADIDALTDFAATVTGTTTVPAAFLDITRDFDLLTSTLSINAAELVEVNKTVTAPFLGSETNKNDDDFENVSFAQVNNLLFISNGYNFLHKYDGQTVYRAGLPKPTQPTTALGGAGSLTGTYRHAIRYVQIDNVGNIVEANISDDSSPDLSPAAESIDVTISNLTAGTGFNTNCAIVDGAQVTVTTITVDDGSGGAHTLKSGDTAYFFDSVTGDFVERAITSVTGTSITIAGAAVTVADNAVISNNLRIQIFRNKTGGTFKFLVSEEPNNSFTATQVINDDIVDGSLGIQFIAPLASRDLPPSGKYISQFNSQLAVAGVISRPNETFWSDIAGPEFFPPGNTVRTESNNSDPTSGITQNGEALVIFEERAVHTITGDLANNNIRNDTIVEDVGCVAHATIQKVVGGIQFLSDRGVFRMVSGQLPQEVSTLIEPVFEQTGVATANKFIPKRAVAINDRKNQKYILFLPVEAVTGGDKYATTDSKIFVNDYFRKAWLQWSNMNLAGGATVFGGELYWQERRFSTFNSSVDHILYMRMNNDDSFDYMDNDVAIDFSYSTNWYSLGEPSVFKKFNRIKAFAIPETINNSFNVTLKQEANFQDSVTKSTQVLNLSGVGEGYGVAPYGIGPYGDSADPSVKSRLSRGKFKAMRLIFENSEAQQNINLTGWELDITTPYRGELKE